MVRLFCNHHISVCLIKYNVSILNKPPPTFLIMEFNFKNSPYQIGCQKSFYWYQYNLNFWYRDIHTGRADFEKCTNMLVLVAGRKMPFGRSQTLWSLSRSCGMRSRRGTLTTVWAATLSSAGGSASTAAGDGPSKQKLLGSTNQ